MNDMLVFASMLYRTNDRFVAPLNGGFPFFVGMKPKCASHTKGKGGIAVSNPPRIPQYWKFAILIDFPV